MLLDSSSWSETCSATVLRRSSISSMRAFSFLRSSSIPRAASSTLSTLSISEDTTSDLAAPFWPSAAAPIFMTSSPCRLSRLSVLPPCTRTAAPTASTSSRRTIPSTAAATPSEAAWACRASARLVASALSLVVSSFSCNTPPVACSLTRSSTPRRSPVSLCPFVRPSRSSSTCLALASPVPLLSPNSFLMPLTSYSTGSTCRRTASATSPLTSGGTTLFTTSDPSASTRSPRRRAASLSKAPARETSSWASTRDTSASTTCAHAASRHTLSMSRRCASAI
mmetsp:Transcript_28314/g.70088  ORF Transcript_28314/g.70088 Transcript_28314/m.70088 type:complete len:281 (-) Transcript_28314:705-1547(-)